MSAFESGLSGSGTETSRRAERCLLSKCATIPPEGPFSHIRTLCAWSPRTPFGDRDRRVSQGGVAGYG